MPETLMNDPNDPSAPPSAATRMPDRTMTVRMAACYGLLGALWIVCSWWWLHDLLGVSSPERKSHALTGWSLVSAAGLLLGFALHRNLREIRHTAELLRADEERWKQALEGAAQAAWDWNAQTNEVFYSASWKSMLGFDPAEIGPSLKEWESRVHPEDFPRVMVELNRHLSGQTPAYASEYRLRCKDGSYKWVQDQGKVMTRTGDGKPLRVVGTHFDITDRKRVEGELRRWADAFKHCAYGIAMTTPDSNRILVCNPNLAAMLGRPVEAFAGLQILDLYLAEDHALVEKSIAEADRVGQVRYEARKLRQDGSSFPAQVDVVSVRDEHGRIPYRISTVQDITARRQSERLQTLSADVLRILNDPQALPNAAQRILDAIQRETGIEAVAIRLNKDAHFPYAAAAGFSPDFLAAENDLTSRTCNGQARLDDQGHFQFECTCGLVLSGRSDPENTSLTPGGSAWTNDARPSLRIPASQDPRLHPRNRCIHEGFHSVALVPIRADHGIIGLLQLNDRRKGCFSPEMLRYLEGLAASFGVALLRLKEEQAVRQAEQKYRGIFESAVEGIFQAAPNGTLLSANPAMARILGFECPQDLIQTASGTPFPFLLNPVRSEDLQREIEQNGVLKDVEVRLHRQDGRTIWVSSNVWPVLDAAGKIARYEGTVADVTVRKQAEAVLHDRLDLRDQLAKVAATVPGMIFSFLLRPDGSACLPFCTPIIEKLWGLRPQEVVADFRPAFDRIHPDDLDRVRQGILESARTMTPWRATFRVRHPRKGELWLEGHSMPRNEGNGNVLWHGFVQDVSVAKQAESALEASRAHLEAALASMTDAVCISDAEGRFTHFNDAFATFHKFRGKDECAKTFAAYPEFLEVCFPDGKPAPVEEWAVPRALRGETGSALEVSLRRRDTDEAWVGSYNFAPIRDKAGRIVGSVVTGRDITERKRFEEQFRQAQRLEAIGQLAGGVAHDFNNILAAMMMHLGLLQMNPEIDDETRQSLTELEGEARRAASLTRQLLMFSRRSVMTMHPVDLSSVVANLLKMLTRLIGENITLRFDCVSSLPLVEADAGMIEQVVVNLVVNARDALPKGGLVAIGTQVVDVDDPPPGDTSGPRSGRFVCLSVSDTGHGMDRETLRRIFEPFYTTKESGKGTGLGLATVHGIVAQHRGWVAVESEINQGTTFRVFLPALKQTTSPIQPVLSANTLRHGHETILVVEDDATVRDMVVRTLLRLGYQVYEAANGQAAMTVWRSHGTEVDLLLTDMVMPEGMSGLELTEQLQTLNPQLLAIISSGYSAEIVHAGVPDQPGIIYLPKPYEIETLAETVRNHLGRRARR